MFRRKGPSEVEVARENEVKLSITQELSKALKDVQKENVGTEDQAVYSTETANSVCACLEAILLHGLKAKTVNKIANYMGMGQQALSQPSLNFWHFAAKFTHGEVISQLKHLGQITTEIGLCRAWVRVALNDCLMESYIDSMVADKRTLEYYYQRTAYLRDSEQPEIMKSLLHGLMTFQFKLSYNASVLNQWSYRPLILSGIIDPKEAPPPIIKPSGSKPQSSRSDTGHGQRTESSSLSKGTRKSKQNNRPSDNPMDHRPFGQPSEDTYYVTSSEFTSKDVENFKRFGKNSGSPMTRSECSSSSRVSCPDPPKMNASPQTYVPHRLSERSFASQSASSMDMFYDAPDYSGNPGLTMYDENFSEKGDIASTKSLQEYSADSQSSQQTEALNDFEKDKISDEIHLPPINQPPEELLNDIYSELNPVNDTDVPDNKETCDKNALEESWEEFYRSPDKHGNIDEPDYRKKFQRLESYTQEIKERAIVSGYNELTNAGEITEGILKVDDDTETCDVSSFYKRGDSTINNPASPYIEDKVEANNDGNETTIAQTMENYKPEIVQTEEKEVTKVVDVNIQKIVKEENVNSASLLTESNLKLLEEELSNYVEEKVTIGDRVDETVAHESVSPVKKKKKSSASMNKLKPPLSLSPPRQGALTPELSDAVADEVSTIAISDDKGYLKKHRLSLPAVSAIHSNSIKSGHRQSMPNLTENIEDDLIKEIYDGIPLDQDKDIEQDIPDDALDEEEDKIRQRQVTDEPQQSLGNSLMSGRGWSSSFDSELGDTVDALSSPKVPGSLPIRPKTESFGTLLQNYTPASSIGARSIDDILHNFPQSANGETASPQSTGVSPAEQGADNLEGFEVVMDTEKFDSNDIDRLTHIAEIVNERGLDAQNFQCKGCQRAVGMIFGKPRVCKFDGGYYCYECHENDEYYIPALIVHNWDFRKHKVSKKNMEFIQEIEEQPCINLEQSNSRLYEHVTEMQDIKALRTQLIYLKSYLFTCKQSVAEDLRRLVWPRDYLFENTEEYSLADLLQVPTGALASSLRKTIRFCTKHVYSCRLCSQKGFICELCHNVKVIYPFETDNTYRCQTCKSVFHKDCKTDNRPCPKCQRRLRRESTHGMVETPTAVDYAFVTS